MLAKLPRLSPDVQSVCLSLAESPEPALFAACPCARQASLGIRLQKAEVTSRLPDERQGTPGPRHMSGHAATTKLDVTSVPASAINNECQQDARFSDALASRKSLAWCLGLKVGFPPAL